MARGSNDITNLVVQQALDRLRQQPEQSTVVPNVVNNENATAPTVPNAATVTAIDMVDPELLAKLDDKQRQAAKKKIAKVLRNEWKATKILNHTKTLQENRALVPLVSTVPERKPVLAAIDNLQPEFRIGDYVKVCADTSPGNNRPQGYGYVTKCNGFAAATIISVKMEELHGVL